MHAATLLDSWLAEQLPAPQWQWLQESCQLAQDERQLALRFSGCARHAGKARLHLTKSAQAAAGQCLTGWRPDRWLLQDAARGRLALAADANAVDGLFPTADLGEHISLARSLAILPGGARWGQRAAETIRTNAPPVFTALAHHNPYPAQWLAAGTWNQMVLKALFIGVPLDPIQGLDRRANADLTRMLLDYVRERRAAGRSVPPALWRVAIPAASENDSAIIATALDGPEQEALAAAKALSAHDAPWARDLVSTRESLHSTALGVGWAELENA